MKLWRFFRNIALGLLLGVIAFIQFLGDAIESIIDDDQP